jgi:hypothetical protein
MYDCKMGVSPVLLLPLFVMIYGTLQFKRSRNSDSQSRRSQRSRKKEKNSDAFTLKASIKVFRRFNNFGDLIITSTIPFLGQQQIITNTKCIFSPFDVPLSCMVNCKKTEISLGRIDVRISWTAVKDVMDVVL